MPFISPFCFLLSDNSFLLPIMYPWVLPFPLFCVVLLVEGNLFLRAIYFLKIEDFQTSVNHRYNFNNILHEKNCDNTEFVIHVESIRNYCNNPYTLKILTKSNPKDCIMKT